MKPEIGGTENSSNPVPGVVFESEDLFVLNKPAGLVVHSDGKTTEKNLVGWLLSKFPNMSGVGEPWTKPDGSVIDRSGIVHRLDRDTSGVLVVARNATTFEFLKQQFQTRQIQKVYQAFLYGVLKTDKGVIDKSIGKSKSDFRKWSAERGARGVLREAKTEYRVLQRGLDATYVEIQPQSGRTHQIRVHMKALHHPVVCDKLYAPKQKCILGFKRQALHALSISFQAPTGEIITATAPIPADFKEALQQLT